MFPKIVHYCWFGPKKPELIQKCISSWKKFLPGYKIIEWNDSNFMYQESSFAKIASAQKKWGYLSDYVRVKNLLNQGGIYLDSDVEVLKDLSPLLNKYSNYDGIIGFADATNICTVILIFKPNCWYIEKLNEIYKNKKDLSGSNEIFLSLLLQNGLPKNWKKNKKYTVKNVLVLPKKYFDPGTALFSPKVNKIFTKLRYHRSSYTIHYGIATWMGPVKKTLFKFQMLLEFFGLRKPLKKIYHLVKKMEGKK